MTAHPGSRRSGSRRYDRDTPEFGRVANLSDGVFAIAMTLLVLTLDVPDVEGSRLAGALADRIPQLITVALAFTLVANMWWAHHKFFGLLGVVEPGLIAINLVLLGFVALVPFPTSLIGASPTERAAVIPFVGFFVITLLLFLLMLARARAASAWREPMPRGLHPWLVGGLTANIAVMATAVVVAWWAPVAALVIAAISGTSVGIVMYSVAPSAYRHWAAPG
jgi:uncharacterized membrane protein